MEELKKKDDYIPTGVFIFFGALGIALAFLMAIIIIKVINPEWKVYQNEFRANLFLEATDELTRRLIKEEPLGIKQIAVKPLNVVDRCTTCHLGVDDPKFKDAAQPYRTHPDYEQHPFEKYGCTTCHRGQGRATTKEAAHGNVKGWHASILGSEYLEASCAKCHSDTSAKVTPNLITGKKLLGEKACYGCHRIGAKGGRIGPELTKIGREHGADWIARHFKNPQEVVPGSKMPTLDLTEDEIKFLTLYMLSLSGDIVPTEYQTAQKLASEIEMRIAYATPVEAGRGVFQKYGCATCHGVEGRGDIKNPNAQTGEEVPGLIYVKEGFSEKELKDRIENGMTPEKLRPEGPEPLRVMPAWRGIIEENEINNLMVYLFSLYPEKAEEKW